MLNIKIIGKKGSKSRIDITKDTGIRKYNKNSKNVDVVINYGLSGIKMQSMCRKFPTLKRIPMINRHIGTSKLKVINQANNNDILVPESRTTLRKKDKLEDWIEKRHHSIGGIGIRRARNKNSIVNKYYQRFIEDRLYELRIHAFSWIDPTKWSVQKRLGDNDVITWNYKSGGHFLTIHNPQSYKTFVNAVNISRNILELKNMGFGAVDFIVTNEGKIYFLEINSAPGFTELSKHIYVDAFKKLEMLNKKNVLKYTN